MNMKKFKWIVLFLALFLLTANSWASDAEEDESTAKDKTSETEDATAGSGKTFNPPHDDHVNSTPEHPTHKSGASAAGGAEQQVRATAGSCFITTECVRERLRLIEGVTLSELGVVVLQRTVLKCGAHSVPWYSDTQLAWHWGTHTQ